MSPAKRTTTRKKTSDQTLTTDREVTTPMHNEQAGDAASIGAAASSGESIEERIRQKAYEIYRARDGGEGRELEDWLTAEREVRHTHIPEEAERAAPTVST
jgi:hypothetical protein